MSRSWYLRFMPYFKNTLVHARDTKVSRFKNRLSQAWCFSQAFHERDTLQRSVYLHTLFKKPLSCQSQEQRVFHLRTATTSHPPSGFKNAACESVCVVSFPLFLHEITSEDILYPLMYNNMTAYGYCLHNLSNNSTLELQTKALFSLFFFNRSWWELTRLFYPALGVIESKEWRQ